MEAVVVKLSERNQMVLPREARAALGLQPGDHVLVVIDDGEVRLMPAPADWAGHMRGLGKEMWQSLGGGDRFLAEERSAWDR
ncbi:MAG: AbrB/MazE/SpoVT family DNA-binding domain-containing protein [Anaerolineae bacterium]